MLRAVTDKGAVGVSLTVNVILGSVRNVVRALVASASRPHPDHAALSSISTPRPFIIPPPSFPGRPSTSIRIHIPTSRQSVARAPASTDLVGSKNRGVCPCLGVDPMTLLRPYIVFRAYSLLPEPLSFREVHVRGNLAGTIARRTCTTSGFGHAGMLPAFSSFDALPRVSASNHLDDSRIRDAFTSRRILLLRAVRDTGAGVYDDNMGSKALGA